MVLSRDCKLLAIGAIIGTAIGYVPVTARCPLIVIPRHLYPVGLQGRFVNRFCVRRRSP